MNKNRTCLITGASGFVGGYLAKAALNAGYTSIHGTCFGDADNAMPGVPMELHELDMLEKLLAMASTRIEIRRDPARMRPSDTPLVVCDNAKLFNATGWKPEIAIEQTLLDILNYWRRA